MCDPCRRGIVTNSIRQTESEKKKTQKEKGTHPIKKKNTLSNFKQPIPITSSCGGTSTRSHIPFSSSLLLFFLSLSLSLFLFLLLFLVAHYSNAFVYRYSQQLRRCDHFCFLCPNSLSLDVSSGPERGALRFWTAAAIRSDRAKHLFLASKRGLGW